MPDTLDTVVFVTEVPRVEIRDDVVHITDASRTRRIERSMSVPIFEKLLERGKIALERRFNGERNVIESS